MPEITNVHVDCLSPDGRAALGWERAGARFHCWIDTAKPPTKWAPGRVYKNPPLGVRSGDPANFSTRTLNPQSIPCAAMLAEAVRQVAERDLVSLARAEAAEKEARDRAAALAATAAQQVRDAAHDLLAALKHCRQALRSIPAANRGEQSIKDATESVISAALAKAEGSVRAAE